MMPSFAPGSNVSMWNISNVTTLVVLVFIKIFFLPINALLSSKASRTVIAVAAPLSMLVLFFGVTLEETSLYLIGCFLGSISNVAVLLLWAKCYESLGNALVCKAVTFGAMVTSCCVLQILLHNAAVFFIVILVSAATGICVLFCSALSKSSNMRETVSSRSNSSFPTVLMLFIFVVSMSFNFLIVFATSNERAFFADEARSVFFAVAVVVILSCVVESFAFRKRATIIPFAVFILFSGAMAMFFFANNTNYLLFRILVFSGYYLFIAMMYCELGIATRKVPGGIKIFVDGLLANAIGITVGTSVAVLVESSGTGDPAVAILFIAYGLTLASFAFFPNSAYKLFTAKTPSEIETSENPVRDLAKRGGRIIGETSQLTPREEDILVLLVRGKSLSSAAEELHLSQNTVKTHAKHLYTKLEIHSKEELMAIFEESLYK